MLQRRGQGRFAIVYPQPPKQEFPQTSLKPPCDPFKKAHESIYTGHSTLGWYCTETAAVPIADVFHARLLNLHVGVVAILLQLHHTFNAVHENIYSVGGIIVVVV